MTYVPPSRESIYAALFAIVSAAQLNGQAAFRTTGRTIVSPDQINCADKPALFQLQANEEWKQNTSGLPYVSDAHVELYIFAAQPDTTLDPITMLNNLIDSIVASLFSNTNLAAALGRKQTLGGLVQNVLMRGKAEYYVGMRGIIGAFAVVPVVIIMPNLQQGI